MLGISQVINHGRCCEKIKRSLKRKIAYHVKGIAKYIACIVSLLEN